MKYVTYLGNTNIFLHGRKKFEKLEISMFMSNMKKNVRRNNSFIICLIIIFVIMLMIMIHNIFSFVEIL